MAVVANLAANSVFAAKTNNFLKVPTSRVDQFFFLLQPHIFVGVQFRSRLEEFERLKKAELLSRFK